MFGNIRPIQIATMEDCINEPISFDEANSYWPLSLKADDLFNGNFKLVINSGAMSQNRKIAVVILYKGERYLMGSLADVPPNSVVTVTWIEGSEPTIREFIESMGGTITETATISFTWEAGYLLTETSFCKMDEIPVSIYVEVPGTDWLTIAVVGGIIVGAGAIGYSLLKKPAAVKAKA